MQTTSTGRRNCGLKPAAIKNFTRRRKTLCPNEFTPLTATTVSVTRRRSSWRRSPLVLRKKRDVYIPSARPGNGTKRRSADPSTDVVARTTSHWRRWCGRCPLDGSSGGQSAPSRMRQAGAACGGVWLLQLQCLGYNRRSTRTVPQSASDIRIHRVHKKVKCLDWLLWLITLRITVHSESKKLRYSVQWQ